jgi:hypothetical protein
MTEHYGEPTEQHIPQISSAWQLVFENCGGDIVCLEDYSNYTPTPSAHAPQTPSEKILAKLFAKKSLAALARSFAASIAPPLTYGDNQPHVVETNQLKVT